MAKRMKKVFSSANQVLHLWANQSQSEARCSNVFFNGKDCYSYGYHYKLGSFVKHKGKEIVLINNKGYSVTTNKHINYAWQAVDHLPRLYTQGKFSVIDSLKTTKSFFEGMLQSHFKKRSFYLYENELENSFDKSYISDQIKEFNKTCDIIGAKSYKIKVSAKYKREYLEHVHKCVERKKELEAKRKTPEYLEKKEKERQRKIEREKEKTAQQIIDWKSGSGNITDAVRNLSPQIIRIQGSVVETSRGARVDLSEAKTFLSRILKHEVNHGEKIGNFIFNRVKDNIVNIGCHNIDLDQAKEVLNHLKLVKDAS